MKYLCFFIFLLGCKTEFSDNYCPSLENCTTENSDDSSGNITVTYSSFFSDDFNRAAESPVAAPWNYVQGSAGDDFEIRSNTLTPKTGAGATPSAFYSVIVSDLAVRITVTAAIIGANFPAATPGEIIVWGRSQSATDTNNGYFCGINPNTGTVTLGKNSGGSSSLMTNSTSSFTLDNGDSFAFTFLLVNDEITCTIVENGTLTISAMTTDSDYSTGYAGVQGGKNGADELTFDDFLIESGDPN